MRETMLSVLRSEIKYALPLHECSILKDKLSKLMLPDPHNGSSGYSIRSLYYDTMYDTDLVEKLDGTELRRKVRLRCYDPTQGGAKLELKQKQGNLQLKRSLSLSRSDAQAVARGDYSPLLFHPEPFAAECYGLIQTRFYRPKVIVEYKRTAFIARENDVRITFDTDITATEACLDLFDPHLLLHPVRDPYNVVLEVKYNGFLPGYIKEMLQSANVSPVSIGKYALAR